VSNKSRRNTGRRTTARQNTARSQRPAHGSSPQPRQQAASGFRPTLERLSAPWLVTLHRLPRWLVPVILAVFLFIGLISSGPWIWVGALMLGIITLFVAWLSALAWPVLTPGSRLARVLIVVALGGVTVLKAMGRM